MISALNKKSRPGINAESQKNSDVKELIRLKSLEVMPDDEQNCDKILKRTKGNEWKFCELENLKT